MRGERGAPERARRWIGLLLLGAAAGCAAGVEAGEPREIAVGVDACDYCHMSIDAPERAAQWVPAVGPVRTFDEPGCLLAWLRRGPGGEGRAYVADESGGGWVPAEEATYLLGAVRTGMGFDVVAYASAAEARARAARGEGEVLGWETLNERGVRDVHAH